MTAEQEGPGYGPTADYSCYITIINQSDSSLLLSDFGIEQSYGTWPLYQPWNTIEPRESGTVHLKDRLGLAGSEGWVKYEVKVGDRTETFALQFCDPTAWLSKNYLRGWSSDNNRLRVTIEDYEKKGHPFYGKVRVDTNPRAMAEPNPEPCPWNRSLKEGQSGNDGTVHAQFEVGFDVPGPWGDKNPIHENIAIAAFIRSAVEFPKATTYNNLNHKQWEYFRGMIWNDDPSCLLFDGASFDNRDWGLGLEFGATFEAGDPGCMTQRSHFGDLQFLHAMGAGVGEKPHDTRDRMLKWMGVMYKLACGNQGVAENQSLQSHFHEYFRDSTKPSGSASLRALIVATTPQYQQTNIPFRALGICMHMIQDSYAMGHVSRRLLNPQDVSGRDGDRHIYFKPGTFARWGAIVAFHTYLNQDDDRHGFYDGLEGADMPDPRNLDSFNRLHGARDAIQACTFLINAFARKLRWEDVRGAFEEHFFLIDPNAKDCNTGIDEKIPGLDSAAVLSADQQQDRDYQIGLLQKMSSLELGLPADHALTQTHRRGWMRTRALICLLLLVCGVMSVTCSLFR